MPEPLVRNVTAVGVRESRRLVADADAVRVAAEILENMLAPAERGFRVDVPIDAKDRAHQAREGLGIPKVGEAYEALFAVSSWSDGPAAEPQVVRQTEVPSNNGLTSPLATSGRNKEAH